VGNRENGKYRNGKIRKYRKCEEGGSPETYGSWNFSNSEKFPEEFPSRKFRRFI